MLPKYTYSVNSNCLKSQESNSVRSKPCQTHENEKLLTLLICSKDTCLLLDVGEGTLGQIHRFYGVEAENVIKKLKAIYISHLHADHHIGNVFQ